MQSLRSSTESASYTGITERIAVHHQQLINQIEEENVNMDVCRAAKRSSDVESHDDDLADQDELMTEGDTLSKTTAAPVASGWETATTITGAVPNSSTTIKPLGIVFDIDGTLIAETSGCGSFGVASPLKRIRPHTIELLRFCLARGHHLAIWTAAHTTWADTVARKLCTLVHSNDHPCAGKHCRRTFDFVWCGKYMRKDSAGWTSKYNNRQQQAIMSGEAHCQWCEFYASTCRECTCHTDGPMYCTCRDTKDLRKIWYQFGSIHPHFTRERTLFGRKYAPEVSL